MADLHCTARLFFQKEQFESEPRKVESIGVKMLQDFEEHFAEWRCVGTYMVTSTIIDWKTYGKGYLRAAEG